jgi:hypothetical protein
MILKTFAFVVSPAIRLQDGSAWSPKDLVMSRFVIAFALVLSTSAAAFAAPSRSFARPPVATTEAASSGDAAVAPILDRAAIRARLLEHRLANLERFRAYQRQGVFPSNTYTNGLLNVWLDDAGHLCAAATIIKASGGDALVMQVARDDNFIRLADVTQGPLLDWILTSGLTQAEIVAIQKPFMGVVRPVQPVVVEQPAIVDARLRAAEDARLAKLYRAIDARIVKNQRASLELAVDRLMNHPALAAKLLAS